MAKAAAASLEYLVRAGTFRARTQHKLLTSAEIVPWPALAAVQKRYREASDEESRRSVARHFERLVRQAHEEAERRETGTPVPDDAFTVDHFRAWASELILDSGEPWRLEPFQEAFAADVLAGVSECWFVVPTGNGKSTLLSGIALYYAEYRRDSWIPVAASSRGQARIIYRQAKGFVKRTPRLDAIFRCFDGYRRIDGRENGSEIEIFAADERTGDGIIPTLCIIDELHRHRDLDLYLTWADKLDKQDGQLLTISTAGEPGADFEETRERIRQQATEVTREGCFLRAKGATTVLHEWAIPENGDPEDLELVKAANPFSGVTLEKLKNRRARPTMTLSHWKRYTCNMPTRSDLAAITELEWHAARGQGIPIHERIWLGIDVGWKYDPTALVPFLMKSDEDRRLGEAVILDPLLNGSQLELSVVEEAIAAIHERNPIKVIVMDISDARDVAEWCESNLGCIVVERGTGTKAQVADYKHFMEALRNGWLTHVGDRGLTRHALNAVARALPLGDYVFARPVSSRTTSSRLQDQRRIDALVAAAMVHAVAVENAVGSVYDERGMVTV